MKLKYNLHVYARRDYTGKREFRVDTAQCMSEHWGPIIHSDMDLEIEFSTNEETILQLEVARLQTEKQKILAECHVKAENIQQQINELLAIENKCPEVQPYE